MKYLFHLLLICILSQTAFGQETTATSPIIFVYDASGSMWGQMDGKTKMEIASDVLTGAVNNLPDGQKVGLVAYGHRVKGDCEDVEFLVDVSNSDKQIVNSSIERIKPLGKTPLAYSARQVIDKLRATKEKATIILVTDGIESCGGNICDVIKAARAEGIDLKLHIIGFGLKDADTEQLKCAAEAGGGNYYDADNAGGLSDVIDEATAITVEEADPNYSVYAVKNGVAVDAWVRAYDIKSKREPIAVRTYRDTGFFYLPPSTYNFEVEPLEGSDVDGLTISDLQSFADRMEHQTISFDGGTLGITTTNNGANWDCIVKMIDANGKVAASARTYDSPKEIEVNPGLYTIRIEALSKMEGLETITEIEDVIIKANELTPVSHDFKSGEFQIYTTVSGENVDAIIKVHETGSGKNVAGARTYQRGARFILNPGSYTVKVQPLGVHKSKASQTISVEIQQGELTTKTLSF